MQLDDHQMPLFEWYLLEEEFVRRLKTVSAWIERYWPKHKHSPQELAQRVFSIIEIYPLELMLDKLVVEQSDGTCAGKVIYRYDYYIPYLGDDILWNLAPRGLLKWPEGEAFRRTLILVITCEPEFAEQLFRTSLAKIVDVLEAQAREIDDFHSTLWARINELLCIARENGLHALPS
jgi:hypothetical protein